MYVLKHLLYLQITALQACRVMAESEEEESTAELQQKQQQSDMAKQVGFVSGGCGCVAPFSGVFGCALGAEGTVSTLVAGRAVQKSL